VTLFAAPRRRQQLSPVSASVSDLYGLPQCMNEIMPCAQPVETAMIEAQLVGLEPVEVLRRVDIREACA